MLSLTLPAAIPLPILLAILAITFIRPRSSTSSYPIRDSIVSPQQEHVLILGGSSGVGEALVRRYAERGAKICIVARRIAELERVKLQSLSLLPINLSLSTEEKENRIIILQGDISNPDDMIRIREGIMEKWNRLDTLHIISGLPSTQTLLSLASSPSETLPHSAAQNPELTSTSLVGNVDQDGLNRVKDEIERCSSVNVTGVALAIAAFLPILSSTSASPLIHHLSSLAALIPAPTRVLYSATKAGGLALFRTAGWEQTSVSSNNDESKNKDKQVRFLAILPGTIDTDFRRKSKSAERGFKPSEEFEKRTLSVDQTVDSIIHHSSLLTLPVSLPLPFTPLALQLPFLNRRPSDLVFLPEWPYRAAYWALDTGAVGWVREGARKKYGVQ